MLTPFIGFTQQAEVKQLRFLLSDLKNNFKETTSTALTDESGDSSHLSKTNLPGSIDNRIDVAPDGKTWVSYTAYISDSCSLKKAKRLADYWRNIVRVAAPGYAEQKQDGNHKTVSGHSFRGYSFELNDGVYKYWIDISYAERPMNNGYSVLFILGKQIL